MFSNKHEEPQSPDTPSLAELKAEQARLHEQIDHLEQREHRLAERVPGGGA
jgi:hypothetical protein